MDERQRIRREVIAELIARAEREAAGHDEIRRQAEEYGKGEMAMRAEASQTAWRAIITELRMMV